MKKIVVLTTVVIIILGIRLSAALAMEIDCWFPPDWEHYPKKALAITKAITEQSDIPIKPRIAKSYPQILEAFDSSAQSLVYAGSFVQVIIKARNLGTPLVQAVNGKEYYSGVLVFPKGEDPEALLKKFPEQIAFAKGASSGESSAKAATGGKAKLATASHEATCLAVMTGKARAGTVKNWWWETNREEKCPGLDIYKMPGISIEKNPDNVLTAAKAVPADVQQKIASAAAEAAVAFGASEMVPFEQSRLDFSLDLMKAAKIDPKTYTWE